MVVCVMLAAGEGKRMHPLTYTRPKVMLPLANRPLIEWNLMNAKKAGISKFIFIVGYRSDMVRSYFDEGGWWDVSIEYVNQGKPLGTGHAVGMVESFVDDFIVLCGDTIFGSSDIKNVMKQPYSMGLVEVDDPSAYGVVETKKGCVVRIVEKMDKPFSHVINAGLYHFDRSIFKCIKSTKKSVRGEYELTDSINLLAQKQEVVGVSLGAWRDVVYPWDLLDANQEVVDGLQQRVEGTVEDGVTLKGMVVVGVGSVVRSGSYIQGPVVIGRNCVIGPNCYLRPYTVVGDGCHVGAACEMKNTILMHGSNVPHQNYVGDSVIGEGCNLGAGTKVANLRLDKQNVVVMLNGKKIDTGRRKLGVIMGDGVQIGVNAMLNVGSVIGNDVCIGPGCTVSGEVGPKAKIL